MKAVKELILNPKQGQTLDDRLIELAVLFIKDNSIKVQEEEINYNTKIGEISFQNDTTKISITREYFCFGWNKDEYDLMIKENKVYLKYGKNFTSTADIEFQKELISYLQK